MKTNKGWCVQRHTVLHSREALARWFELQEESWQNEKQAMGAFPKVLAVTIFKDTY